MDIIDEKHIGLTIFLAEFHERPVLDGIDELVGELLARQVDDLGCLTLFKHMVANGVQEVGFSQPAHAIKKQRVVSDGGRIGHGKRR